MAAFHGRPIASHQERLVQRGAREAYCRVSRCRRVFSSRNSATEFLRNQAKGGLSMPFGDRVKISTPVSVTPTVCSNCAESERSRVTAVHPSLRIFTP